MILLALAACQEPFGTDRHDLVGFRIAAVRAPPVADGGRLSPRAALIVDGRAWSETPVDLAWFLLRDPSEVEALDPLSPADGFGPQPELAVPSDRRVLGLVARHGDLERRAFVELARPLESLRAPTGILAEPRSVDPGETLRLEAEVPGGAEPLLRWMATGGSFFEVDRTRTDWVASDGLWIDDGELQGEAEPLPRGPVTVLALALGSPGEVAWRAAEIHVGEPGEGVWVGGRFLPGEGLPEVPAGWALRSTLAEDPSSPVGFSLRGGEAVDPAGLEDWGTGALPCLVGRSGPLDPAWWLEQVCFTRGLEGLEVALLPEPAP